VSVRAERAGIPAAHKANGSVAFPPLSRVGPTRSRDRRTAPRGTSPSPCGPPRRQPAGFPPQRL